MNIAERIKQQGSQASVLMVDMFTFGTINGSVDHKNGSNITISEESELGKKIRQWHKNPNKIFLVLRFTETVQERGDYIGEFMFNKHSNYCDASDVNSSGSTVYHTNYKNLDVTLNTKGQLIIAWGQL